MNRKIIKNLNILKASYIFEDSSEDKIILNINYAENKFVIDSKNKNNLYSEVEKKAIELLKRKSGVNLV